MSLIRANARIGWLFFKYEDPNVNVTTEANTIEKETIDGSVIIQQIGRKPSRISINAIVSESEAGLIDLLPRQDVLSLRTERWSGDVIIKSTNTRPMRAIDKDENWLYKATIKCIGVERSTGDSQAPTVP